MPSMVDTRAPARAGCPILGPGGLPGPSEWARAERLDLASTPLPRSGRGWSGEVDGGQPVRTVLAAGGR